MKLALIALGLLGARAILELFVGQWLDQPRRNRKNVEVNADEGW